MTRDYTAEVEAALDRCDRCRNAGGDRRDNAITTALRDILTTQSRPPRRLPDTVRPEWMNT